MCLTAWLNSSSLEFTHAALFSYLERITVDEAPIAYIYEKGIFPTREELGVPCVGIFPGSRVAVRLASGSAGSGRRVRTRVSPGSPAEGWVL